MFNNDQTNILKTLLIFFLTFVSFNAAAQHEGQEDYLTLYGQVWGFLKYFHPQPGEQNWDDILLNDFDELISCKSDSVFNEIISDMVETCGDYKQKERSVEESQIFNESYEWLYDSLLNDVNTLLLNNLFLSKPSFKNKYISKASAGNPKITNEIEYGTYAVNPAVQYLAITRYWNVINYFFPYRDIIPKNWTQVYKDNVLTFINAKTYDEYYFAVRKITTEIRDAHGFIKTEKDPLRKYKFAPFYCVGVSDGYYITAIFQDSLETVDLKKMDKLISIDGKPIKEKFQEISNIVSTSNDYDLYKLTHYLRISSQDSMTLTVEREGELITNTYATVERQKLNKKYSTPKSKKTPTPYKFLKDSISGKEYCYIDMAVIERSHIDREFESKLLATDHIIIDSRNYPNWTVIKLSKILIKGEKKFAKFVEMDFDYPGSFLWSDSQTIGHKKRGYDGKIYVLVDYNTQSQAEYTVMAFQQHPNTVVIGVQTAGADGNVSTVPFPYGIKSGFSGLGVFYPDGRPTQQVGVHRDYKLLQNRSFLEGEDIFMDKALELIRDN